jgi:glycosyltransferase involved in cell wall biosynthesis
VKLIIQIPCFNEEETLGITLSHLPREIQGINDIGWLVIDDGSTDQTVKVAKEYGVDHIVSHSRNKGLAKAFMSGINACIESGADIIINTDADNQYNADSIINLIEPILHKNADIVVGTRPISEITHFSLVKKYLQKLGSWVVRVVSNTDIPDATSGFRAFSREAAKNINVYSDYTYTLETIIQAGQKNMTITSVPVKVNNKLRPSRLIKSVPSYILKAMITIIRIFVVYRPFRFFIMVGSILFGLGFILGFRFLVYYFLGEGKGHIQSLILASILIGMGFQTFIFSFIADLLSVNRKLLENLRYKMRKVNKDDEC